MKNVTFSADEQLIEAARARARSEQTTLNEAFRRWLEDYVGRERQAEDAARVVVSLQGRMKVGRRLTRDEMNAR